MKQKFTDIMILSILSIGISFTHLTPVVYPYVASYCYNYNKDITMEGFYLTFLFLALGYPVGNYISPFLLNILGIVDTFLLLSFFNVFFIYGFIQFVTLESYFVLYLVFGIQYQICMTSINLFLTLKYKNGIQMVKYIYTVRLFVAILMTYISQKLINPQNIHPVLMNSKGNKFFEKNVTMNFVKFITFFNIACCCIFIVFSRILQNPAGNKNRLVEFIQSIFNDQVFENEISQEIIQISQHASNVSYEFNNTLSRSLIKATKYKKKQNLEENLSNNLEQISVDYQNYSVSNDYFFLLMIFILFINTIVNYFCIDQFKYVGLIISFSDYTLSTVFLSTGFAYIISGFVLSYIWEKFSFRVNLLVLVLSITIQMLLVIFSQYEKNLFLLSGYFARFNMGYSTILNDVLCFGFYPSEIALQLVKYVSFSCFAGTFLESFLNYVIFDERNYLIIYYLFLVLNIAQMIIAYIIITKIKHPKKIDNENQQLI